jgi:predicted transglutaminase-like cysteine proteinase
MTTIRRHSRLLLVAVCCVAVGAAISAIASAGAAPSTSHSTSSPAKHVKMRARGLRRLSRAVQGSAVVRTANGFANVTFARGKVDAVSGQQLTIAEGTRQATYKTVTVTVPTGAVVRDNRQKATLSDVKAGQRVLVLTAPKHTYVIARTPKRG